MATIKPFKSIRPRTDLVDKIAALPYDVYNRTEALAEVTKEPLSFLKIDRAETQFDESVDTYEACVYEKAKEILDGMISDGSFIEEDMNCYYLYELTMNGRSQTGIVACAAIDDYQNNIIKKHENTRADKEIDRITHVDTCSAQTGPIFLAYRSKEEINEIVSRVKSTSPLYDFTANDGVGHTVWRIDNQQQIEVIYNNFASTNSIYIADGHHRAASAVKVGLKRRLECKDYTGEEEFNYFLSVLFPDDQLMIMDYNRVVADTCGKTKAEFLTKIQENFNIEEKGNEQVSPKFKGEFGMYFDNTWYKLTIHEDKVSSHPVKGLDVSILQDYLLTPILNIQDVRTDKRIDFVGGIRGLSELERRVNLDMKVAFAMYPTSIQELFMVSDADLLMPPKSTWFEPKLRSGIFIHKI